MGISDYLILAALLTWLVGSIRWIRKHPGCGGDCAGCSHAGNCKKKPPC